MSGKPTCGKHCKKQTLKCIPCVTPNTDDGTAKTSPENVSKEQCECSANQLCSPMGYPDKVDVTSCAPVPPKHPCDPEPPCDPLSEPEGDCIPPFLCTERLKNPESPDYLTRCKSGASIGVRACAKSPPPHPCDTPAPCSSLGKPKKMKCDDPPLCKEKIKNQEPKKIRRVLCTDSKGETVEAEISK